MPSSPSAFVFNSEMIGSHLDYLDGFLVRIASGTGGVTIVRDDDDMFSHPHIGFAADGDIEETQALREFINCLIPLKKEASFRLRWYILQLIYDDGFRQRFLDHTDEALAIAPLTYEEREALREATHKFQTEVEAFKPGNVVGDGGHFLLFPQSVERIAPRAWFEAAWPYLEHFRSNFGFYLGEALLYSRVTILGSVTRAPMVTEEQERYLKREIGDDMVERISVASADGVGRVLGWGVNHEVRFGLGDGVSEMILKSRYEEEIMNAIRAKFEPERFTLWAR